MADWASPQLSSTYTVFRQALNDRLVDAALMFDSASTSATNIPSGAKRWNSTSSKFEKYNGSTWGDLAALYAINISGNAATATRLATARSIGGVSFNGSASINLPGVNIAGNQNTTGNAATATKLAASRNIGGVSFDGSASINLPGVNTSGNQDTSGYANAAKYVYNGANPASTPMTFQQTDSGQIGGYIWCRSDADSTVQQLLHSSILQVSYAVNAGSAVNATNARYLTTCVGGDIGSVVDSYGNHTAIGDGLYYIQGYGGRWRRMPSSNLFQRFD